MPAPPEVIAAAREYFKQGYQVVAVKANKAPWGKNWRRAHNLDEVLKLLEEADCPAIGFLGGELNHWIVPVDFDTAEGDEWFRSNCRLNGIDPDDFPTVITPGKRRPDGSRTPGLHRYMSDIRQCLGNATGPLLAKLGIDIRGAGHAMLPPSPHPDEGNYAWAPRHSLADFGDTSIPPVPDFLYEAIETRQESPQEAPGEPGKGNGADPEPEATFRAPPPPGGSAGASGGQSRAEAYCRAALEGATERLANAPKGRRNMELNNEALGLGHLAHFGAFTEGQALSALMAACTNNGLLADSGVKACHATFYSGWNKGLTEPKELPDDDPPRPGFGTGAGTNSDYSAKGADYTGKESWSQKDTGTNGAGNQTNTSGAAPEIPVWKYDDAPIAPRAWLLGNVFCRQYLSGLLAAGATGKTALRVAQAVELASGKSITGEHIFQRCRVLYVCLEDSKDELKRRIRAACKRHDITAEDLDGWLYLATPAALGLKLAHIERGGQILPGHLGPALERLIRDLSIDLIILDPFVKTHDVEENSNTQIDYVATLLANLADRCNIAVDTSHHVGKGKAEAGNAESGRGASAYKDAGRLIYTLTTMDSDEAEIFNVPDDERRLLIRMDSAKVNILPPAATAKWFKLVSVAIGNANEIYRHGDEVQTVEPWEAPSPWGELTPQKAREILLTIDRGLPDGRRYSNEPSAKDDIAAWCLIRTHLPYKNKKQGRIIVKGWLESGVLFEKTYTNPITRNDAKGLFAVYAKMPGGKQDDAQE